MFRLRGAKSRGALYDAILLDDVTGLTEESEIEVGKLSFCAALRSSSHPETGLLVCKIDLHLPKP